ncbi:XrtA/PEP-CTERM system histidine kinase PrsK [Roseomonas marmotae]|uniref:histidine kinase n=1 Tax=Roseomonas marmotae TaxID=2768161 RepID=A0ABS3KH20_9PROT|nr:XrtA/PEP-CTERM system histidine kinase PrsK [Roseomonas marmotae]MBO1076778.1 PEP-CTERM system histidine kinase PrsK [Roseomonas marmotae]QTI78695.1 PEP-CTERM system histidine kinase PrsK [Roseomonas marmotae]
MTAAASSVLYAGCAAACLAWGLLVLGSGRGRHALLPAITCLGAAAWAAAVALAPATPFAGLAGALEILRAALWFAMLLSAGRFIGGLRARPLLRRFALAGAVTALLAWATLVPEVAEALTWPALGSPVVLTRLALVLLVVLLAENLYRNADDSTRWHVVLPCIALGGLAAFDVLLYAQAALSRSLSPTLADGRAVLTALAAPLLALGAMRDRRWRRNPPVSRDVVFHGATLLVAGSFLLAVGAVGEALRHLDADWAQAMELGIWAATAMALAVGSTARSVRSRLRRYVVDHFFPARYDYRQEWLRCVNTLSAPGMAAPLRAIRAIADPADSPAGMLLLREPGEPGLNWAGSWNLPAETCGLAEDHPLIAQMREGNWIVPLTPEDVPELRAFCGPLWLAVPLAHHREGLMGVVLLAPPRAALPLDGEVFDLLRSLGREVAMFLAERRNAERLSEQQHLQDHAQRFAFMAHDVKNVASQLTLLLANADENIQDPEFQRDMLLTVRASAARINTLIARLRQPEVSASGTVEGVEPLTRLRVLAAQQAHPLQIEDDGRQPQRVAIPPESFDAAVTHLLNNAAEASAPTEPVRVRVWNGERRVAVEIIDRGSGMTPEFIRDGLFRPLATMKPGGSGIGAWQARELLRRAGGDLSVSSCPGLGTTMRLTLPVLDNSAATGKTEMEAALP